MTRRRTAVVLLLVMLSVVERSFTYNDFVGASQGASDFSLSSNVGSRTILRGGSTTYTVTVNALNGFAGSIDLAVSGLPPSASASFDPAILSSAGSSTLTVITGSKTPAGTWTLTITALSGALTRTTTVTLIVTSLPDFTISVTPGSTTIVPGGSSNYTVTVGAQGGFSGTVNLTATGVPPGASASFSPPSILGAGSATLTVTATVEVQTGMSLLTISGASGPLNHSTATNLVISESNASRVIGIDFVGTGRPMGLWGIAGVVPKPNWNSAAGASRTTPLPLMDETGAASGASVIWTSHRTGRLPIKGDTANRRMMREYLDTSDAGATTTVTVAGLPNGAYDVYVYADGGNADSATTAAYSISGAGVATTTINLTDAAHTNFNATFTQAINSTGNYVKFSVVATGFTLTATPVAPSGNSQAPVSAMQIVPAASSPLHAISGAITPANDGAGAAVTLGGAAVASTTADAGGSFSFANLANGSYVVTPTKSGFVFMPANRTVSIAGASVTGVDFSATPSANTIAMSAPANGATVSNAFSMSATASASIVAVQFQVDGVNAGPEDTSAPYSVSVTAPNGGHSLRAIGRDASGATVTSTAISVTVSGGSGTALAVNGAQMFQTMDGFGVNLNSLSWKNGELAPALDRLVDELGATKWRVAFDMMDWEATNDNPDPSVPNWTYYNALYSNAKFQNLWGTLRYLNQKGVTSGIILSFMGRVPPWMGGATITATAQMEDEWVETVATLVYYARTTEQVQFDLLSPLAEPDWDGIEGPQVDQWRYPSLLQKLSAKLEALGLGDLRFVGPETASIGMGVNEYLPELFTNSVVMSKLDHFGLHNYAGDAGEADARIKGSAYPQKNFWITELSIPEQIFTMIAQGAAVALIWDAYDSVYNHAILAGRGDTPPNDAGNLAALMSYSTSTGLYSARPQFYQMETFKYVTPGAVRIGASQSHGSLTVYAFRHPTTGRVTLIGRNTGGSSITLNGSLSGVGTLGVLQFYRTSNSDGFMSFTRGSDAVVTGGSFTATVPSDSFFTLTGLAQ